MNCQFSTIAELLGVSSTDTTVIDTLLTDSRSLLRPESSLFFAIRSKGGNDGHKFIRQLYDRGVRHFVVNEIPENMRDVNDAQFIISDNVVGALQSTGSIARKNCREVVAITGSRGKTTLKEWLFQLLEPIYEVARSPRSFNSRIGVPLSLWTIDTTTEIALIEAGVSEKNEMKILADIISPDTVIFTNIGDAHSDGFDSLSDKAREKALLAASPHVKTVIYNADSPYLRDALSPYLNSVDSIGWSLSDQHADLFVETDDMHPDALSNVKFSFGNLKGSFLAPVAKREDLENVASALAFLLHEKLSPEVIRERFASLHKISTRLNVAEGMNQCSVIHDAYTSDFSSLLPAIDFMKRRAMPEQSLTLILSDILHETAGGADIYQAVADLVRESGVTRFIGIGPQLSSHRSLFPDNCLFFDSTDSFLESISPSDFDSEIILVKGAPEFEFDRISQLLEARKHETVLEVNLDALVDNFNYFRSLVPSNTGIIAMVKAFGYGAGSYEIAKTLQDCGAAYLAVAVLDEGIDLRRNGIRMPVMVMNPKAANYRAMFLNRLEPVVYSLSMLNDVIREAKKNGVSDYPVHLKLDTGMHRTGLISSELQDALDILNTQTNVRLSSVFSHLATSDCIDMDDYTLLQLSRFKEMSDFLISGYPYPVKRHILNTAGIIRFPEYHFDLVRLGIGLYGANTLPEDIEKKLAPVSALRTVIIAIREWDADETIGYGRRGHLERRSRIATIPIGYADGMNRHFGRGKISVKVNGKDAPTVGNICMDQCMIDVTDIDCKVGDTVEIFGPHTPLSRLSDLLDTIPYEILTSVSPRVKRIYYRE